MFDPRPFSEFERSVVGLLLAFPAHWAKVKVERLSASQQEALNRLVEGGFVAQAVALHDGEDAGFLEIGGFPEHAGAVDRFNAKFRKRRTASNLRITYLAHRLTMAGEQAARDVRSGLPVVRSITGGADGLWPRRYIETHPLIRWIDEPWATDAFFGSAAEVVHPETMDQTQMLLETLARIEFNTGRTAAAAEKVAAEQIVAAADAPDMRPISEAAVIKGCHRTTMSRAVERGDVEGDKERNLVNVTGPKFRAWKKSESMERAAGETEAEIERKFRQAEQSARPKR